MKYHIESIFKVMPYYLARSWKMQRYPVLKTDVLETLYMRTLEEAEDYISGHGRSHKDFMEEHPEYSKLSLKYSYIVVELPINMEIHPALGQNLSTRIYLPDGTIWGENTYADFFPLNCHGDEYNYWGRRNDICDHAMCYEFGHRLDTYEVLSFACDQIDHAPTISVFNPTKDVSSRRIKALQKMYDEYINVASNDLMNKKRQ